MGRQLMGGAYERGYAEQAHPPARPHMYALYKSPAFTVYRQ